VLDLQLRYRQGLREILKNNVGMTERIETNRIRPRELTDKNAHCVIQHDPSAEKEAIGHGIMPVDDIGKGNCALVLRAGTRNLSKLFPSERIGGSATDEHLRTAQTPTTNNAQ
jgi:hypothetical protein